MSNDLCVDLKFRGNFILIKIALILIVTLVEPCIGFAAIDVDGCLNEPEWEEAKVFRDFVVIEPLTLDTPSLPTKALLLSLPEGLAVAFICDHPPEVKRTRTITPRDVRKFESDAVSLIIDFDATGEIAYEFDVSLSGSYAEGIITNENSSNYDWDALWQCAVNEESQRWTVEILLPWSIAAMRQTVGETRQIGVSFQREIYKTQERLAFPMEILDRSRLVSDLAKIEVKCYSAQEFDLWPYITVLNDLLHDSITTKAGLDVFWKPSGGFQVSATLNPDFGQVESDDLVIDFSAVETSYNDKRPFFTENQGIFQSQTPKGDQIIYTRRIGGPSDKDGNASDIDGAIKIIGSTESINYGVFTAQEADDEGRSFYAGRVVFPAANWSVGALSTYVDSPFLNRYALVNTIDYYLKWSDSWRLLGQFINSEIDTDVVDNSSYGGYSLFEYTPNEQWLQELILIRYDDSLDINDMGYLIRNNLEEMTFSSEYRQTDFPENSRLSAVTWLIKMTMSRNTDDIKLPGTIVFSRSEKIRSGSNMSIQINLQTDGYDDLISRGNGLVWLNERWGATFSYGTPRRGAWSKSLALKIFQEGYEDWGAGIQCNVTWYMHEKLNFDLSLNPSWSRDWLIWLQSDHFGSYSRRQASSEIAANWFPAEKHEIRMRAQWLTINADSGQGYRLGLNSRLVQDNNPIENFAVINYGFQLRYRYEIAPLSDFYFVYSRGGIENIDNPDKSTLSLLGASTRIRNADQILVKLRYRF